MLPARPTGERHRRLLEQLQRGVLDLTSTDGWRRWLGFSRRFRSYSFHNQLLILAQRPDAAWVAGYRAWQQLGRQVRAGERGIAILAPVPPPKRDPDPGAEEPVAHSFRVVRVFDVGQTEGRALPSPVETLEGADPVQEQLSWLLKEAVELGFAVQFRDLLGSRNGDCSHALRRIRIRLGLPPPQTLKTLAHELAHAILHGPEFSGDRALAELEAESTAYLVCADLGLNSSAYSFGYVAHWAGGGPQAVRGIDSAAARVLAAARRLAPASAAQPLLSATPTVTDPTTAKGTQPATRGAQTSSTPVKAAPPARSRIVASPRPKARRRCPTSVETTPVSVPVM